MGDPGFLAALDELKALHLSKPATLCSRDTGASLSDRTLGTFVCRCASGTRCLE